MTRATSCRSEKRAKRTVIGARFVIFGARRVSGCEEDAREAEACFRYWNLAGCKLWSVCRLVSVYLMHSAADGELFWIVAAAEV
jgi:hypothetical protein